MRVLDKPKFSRVWAMPNADTFQCKPIGEFVKRHLNGVVVDPFARNNGWSTHSNDLNPKTQAHHHMDAEDFLKMLVEQGVKADTIIFDPPYSQRQLKEVYAGVHRAFTARDAQISGRWFECKELCAQLIVPGGKFLQFGWHSNGLTRRRGFEIEEILLVSHGGAHHDTICIAERAS